LKPTCYTVGRKKGYKVKSHIIILFHRKISFEIQNLDRNNMSVLFTKIFFILLLTFGPLSLLSIRNNKSIKKREQ